MMKSRLAAVATMAILAASSSACGSGSDNAATVGGHGGHKNAAEFGAAGRLLTRAEIESVLPTIADLTGWKRDTENEKSDIAGTGDEGTTYQPARCKAFGETDDWAGRPSVKGVHDFKQDDFGPFLGTSIATYDDVVPADTLGDFGAQLAKCRTMTSIDKDGSHTTITASGLDFPNLGEKTFAVHMDANASGFPLAIDVAAIQIGHNVITVSYGGLGKGKQDTSLMAKVAKQIVGGLEKK